MARGCCAPGLYVGKYASLKSRSVPDQSSNPTPAGPSSGSDERRWSSSLSSSSLSSAYTRLPHTSWRMRSRSISQLSMRNACINVRWRGWPASAQEPKASARAYLPCRTAYACAMEPTPASTHVGQGDRLSNATIIVKHCHRITARTARLSGSCSGRHRPSSSSQLPSCHLRYPRSVMRRRL